MLYALTGATSLAYQVGWTRLLAQLFGGTLFTTSCVVACFLGGLAAGGIAFGALADRVRSPLRMYGLLELGIGGYALLSPWLAKLIGMLLPPGVSAGGWKLALTAALLLPPTVLMGATFPALLASWPGHGERKRGAAVLYGCNTLGAVTGVLATAFFLLPSLGISLTLQAAAGVNLLVAVAALALARPRSSSQASPAPLEARDQGRSKRRLALVALALSGFAALLGEIAWMRALGLLLGSSVYAFAIVLAAFLTGITLGSLRYARRQPTADPLEDVVHYELRAALAAALFAVLLTVAPRLLIFAIKLGSGSAWAMLLAAFTVAFAATVYATTSLGAAFPAGIAACLRGSTAGRGSGQAYAANSLGAVLGALLTAAVFIPVLGMAQTLALGVVANLLAALVASGGRRAVAWATLAGSLLAFTVIPWWWRANQALLLSGVYAYAYQYTAPAAEAVPLRPVPPRLRPRPSARPPAPIHEKDELLFIGDGTHANIAVLRDRNGDRSLLIDGKVDASTALDGDMRTQLLLGHLPAIMRDRALGSALVIGLGSGVTASAVVQHSPERLDIVELEPLVAAVARRYFAEANRGVLSDPRVRLILADGRNWVARSGRHYDMITSEPSNLWMSGVASLFTVEFFEEAALALRPGGVLCQWMHLYQVSPSDVRIVLRGIARSFRHAALFVDGPDLLVLASNTAFPDLRQLSLSAAAERDLSSVGLGDAAELGALYLGDERTLRAFAGEGELHRDDRPILEFTAPRSLAQNRSQEILGSLWEAAVRAEPQAGGMP